MKKKQTAKKVTKKVTSKATKKVTKKVTFKAPKKTPPIKGLESILTKEEIKEYTANLKRMLKNPATGKEYTFDDVEHLLPNDVKVIVDEQNILGDEYDKIINDKNTSPDKNRNPNFKPSDASIPLSSVTVNRCYGVLADVALKCGCTLDSFHRLMDFFIKCNLISPGAIADYNISIQNFIAKMKNEKEKRARSEEYKNLKETYDYLNDKTTDEAKELKAKIDLFGSEFCDYTSIMKRND